jgi:hypothetical protein
MVTEKTIKTKRENNGTKRKTEQNKSKQNGKNDKNKTIHIGVGFMVDKVKVLKPIGSLFQW